MESKTNLITKLYMGSIIRDYFLALPHSRVNIFKYPLTQHAPNFPRVNDA